MSSAISSSTSPAATSTSQSAAANTLITSTGIGSGLNIPAIVSALTSSYGAAQQNQITTQQNSLNAQVSAYGTFSSALSTLQATLSTLESPGTLAGFNATVADKTIATATADSTAVAGQYSLTVQNLATVASLSSQPVANSSTIVGTGSLTIALGGASSTITIDSTNNTLAGIADSINNAPDNPGVSASIVTTTAGSRLVLSGVRTGASNSITVTQSGGDGGLSALVYNPADTNVTSTLTQTQAAQDANFTINGYAATSATNIVKGAISGVTLSLLAPTASGATTTLNVAPDTTAAQTSISTFVTAVNGVLSSIQTLTGYNTTTNTAGPLNGNVALEGFQNQLQSILGTINSNSASGVTSLSDLGITANAQGTYDTNTTSLAATLSGSLSGVASLLGGTNGIATQIDSLVKSYTQPGGLLSSINQGLQTGLKAVASQQAALTQQLSVYSATLTTQYNAVDTLIASLKQTQTYLNAEFNPSANNSSSSSASSSSLSTGTTSTGG